MGVLAVRPGFDCWVGLVYQDDRCQSSRVEFSPESDSVLLIPPLTGFDSDSEEFPEQLLGLYVVPIILVGGPVRALSLIHI